MTDEAEVVNPGTAVAPKKRSAKPKKPKRKEKSGSARARTARIYPALDFEACLPLADAIHTHASGDRVARLTLLKAMNLSPTSSATQILITSSGKYGLTKGSYAAEHLELTEMGKIASDKGAQIRQQTEARCELGIKKIGPFQTLYNRYKGKKLPSHDVMRDVLAEANYTISDPKECIDTFIVGPSGNGVGSSGRLRGPLGG